MKLIREDSIYIYDINELREKYTVTINGEVNRPGIYDFGANIKMQDIILAAGGFKDGASNKRIEIGRRIRNTNQESMDKDSLSYAVVKILDINSDMSSISDIAEYVLQPFDVISVRKSPVYKEQVSVSVEGEVNYPGSYIIINRSEKLSDLVRRAGGLKGQAYPEGALLLRNTYETVKDSSLLNSKLKIFDKQNKDSLNTPSAGGRSNVEALEETRKPVGIHLKSALDNPGSLYDVTLESGDVLKVPKQLQTVQTFGAVNVSQKIVYRRGMNLKDAVMESGGFALGAVKSRSYIVNANGEVKATKHFLFFNFYPKLEPGAEIYVISRVRRPLTTPEIIGISSSIIGLGVLLTTLLNSLK